MINENFCPVCHQVTRQMEVFGICKPPAMHRLKTDRIGSNFHSAAQSETYYTPIRGFACESCGVITLNCDEIQAELKRQTDEVVNGK